MRALRLTHAVLIATLSGCTHGTPPAKAPAPAPAPSGPLRGSAEVITRVRDPMLSDTGFVARSRRNAIARSDSVARRLKTLQSTPDSIVMAVGDTLPVAFPLKVTALDSAGIVLEGLVPMLSIANLNIARFHQGGVVAVSEGRTAIRVDALVRGDGKAPARRVARLDVPIIVHAGTRGADVPTDSVPRDLVLALLGASNPRDVALRVGGTADEIPPALLRDARVLGSSASASVSTTVAVLPYSAPAALDTLETRLLAAGWLRPRSMTYEQRGFLSSPSYSGPTNQLCREHDYMNYRATQRDPWSTTVARSYRRVSGQTMCSESRAARYPVDRLTDPAAAAGTRPRRTPHNRTPGRTRSPSRSESTRWRTVRTTASRPAGSASRRRRAARAIPTA